MKDTPRIAVESLLAHVGTTISGGNERIDN
jgi:hypothetical protein